MKLKEFSYRFAKEILENTTYKIVYDELISICKNTPLPVFKGKSKNQKSLDVVQQIINTYFFLVFKNKGWEPEPLATPEDKQDSLRSDFRKTFHFENKDPLTVQIEVEMGNAASSYRNYFKFQLSFSYNLTNICILILPCDNLSKRIDSGLASFEKTVREIPSAQLSVTVPILVIGLDDTDVEEFNLNNLLVDLDILKGSKTENKIEHEKIVQSYIDKL